MVDTNKVSIADVGDNLCDTQLQVDIGTYEMIILQYPNDMPYDLYVLSRKTPR